MITIETVAEIHEDGTLTAQAPASAPRGKQRVVIMIAPKRRLPDLSEFRASLSSKVYPGSSVVDLREEERS
jgi:hypothetical protein